MVVAVATHTAPAQGDVPGLGAVQPHVRAAANVLAHKFGIERVGGWRAFSAHDPGGHPAGLAVDFPCTVAEGNALAAFAIANAGDLAIKYVMWQRRIWYPGKGWKAVADRGSKSANHEDHVHISWTVTGAAAGWLGRLKDGAGNAVDAVTGAGAAAVAAVNPFDNWAPKVTLIALELALVGGGIALVVLGTWRLVLPAAAKTMGQVL